MNELFFKQGYICIVVAAIMSTVYIVFARFEKLSFDRQERYVFPTAEKIITLTEKLDGVVAKLMTQNKLLLRENNSLSAFPKVFIFISAGFAVIMVVVIYMFLSVFRRVFFNVLIGWKGLALGSLSVMMDRFLHLIEQLIGAVRIPAYVVQAALYPLKIVCQIADLFQVGALYNLLTVTCQGAQAPIELFVDSFVLGVSILFIKSKYNFLWAMTLQEMNKSLALKYWLRGKTCFSSKLLLSLAAFMLSTTNPFITVLRFFLSYVNFGAFFANNHLTHALSQACIGIQGFENQELWLVNSTSVLVWWLIFPIVYMAAEILCPKGGFTATRSPILNYIHSRSATSVHPLPNSQSGDSENFRDSDSRRSSIGSIVISDFDEGSEISSSIGSVVVSAFSSSSASIQVSDNDDSSIGSVVISDYVESENSSVHKLDVTDRAETRMALAPSDTLSNNPLQDHQSKVREAQPETNFESGLLLSAYYVLSGAFRYAWSYIGLLFSMDLLLIYAMNAWVARNQKEDNLEQLHQLRTSRRWDRNLVEQRLKEFREIQYKRLHTETNQWNRYSSYFQRYARKVEDMNAKLEEKWLKEAHQSDDERLPPYYRLCFMVQKELLRNMNNVYVLRKLWIPVSIPLSFIIAFSGVGHLLTAVGRKYWGIAAWKYFLFMCACLGFWTDEIYEAYEIEELVREFTILDPDEATVLFIPLTIASRAILLQALGHTSLLISIIVINMCGSPLFVFSPRMEKIVPPLMHFNPREVAIRRERIELLGRRHHHVDSVDNTGVRVEEWVLLLRSLSIFLTESRLLVFFYNFVSLFLTIIILKDINISLDHLTLLVSGLVPYFVGSVLIAIVYIGKRLNLTDNDFKVVFITWPKRVFAYLRSLLTSVIEYMRLHLVWRWMQSLVVSMYEGTLSFLLRARNYLSVHRVHTSSEEQAENAIDSHEQLYMEDAADFSSFETDSIPRILASDDYANPSVPASSDVSKLLSSAAMSVISGKFLDDQKQEVQVYQTGDQNFFLNTEKLTLEKSSQRNSAGNVKAVSTEDGKILHLMEDIEFGDARSRSREDGDGDGDGQDIFLLTIPDVEVGVSASQNGKWDVDKEAQSDEATISSVFVSEEEKESIEERDSDGAISSVYLSEEDREESGNEASDDGVRSVDVNMYISEEDDE